MTQLHITGLWTYIVYKIPSTSICQTKKKVTYAGSFLLTVLSVKAAHALNIIPLWSILI